MTPKNNVHFKFDVSPFAPTYLTVAKGSELVSACAQNNGIVVYFHTVDTRVDEYETRMLGVEMALDDNNWEVWEIRVYRAGMRTDLPDGAVSLGTVILRDGKCFNHVYGINLGVPGNIRKPLEVPGNIRQVTEAVL